VTTEAYSDEVSSCGYWPGGATEGVFYSYAYPEPEGFSRQHVTPDDAHYDDQLGEFVLPYAAVRSASDPDACLLGFMESTFQAAYRLGRWPGSEQESATGTAPATAGHSVPAQAQPGISVPGPAR
jgi:hypothetical protein